MLATRVGVLLKTFASYAGENKGAVSQRSVCAAWKVKTKTAHISHGNIFLQALQ